ncbi:YqiA/YcfP family alpha/beta fold hydrolase [Parvibium lacunae]|uniref:Alpha/beta fold hydrolase n=1 Tax=Parvibium lacunae TaxID=1888893 RepID=A0A368KZY2_9BURK|nr:YqiA/YcfP family alpha/beta fold hydrolase [Parvibium lacunae]RCS56722.1 alpha/beta fold hydrolase [Parvibium lacunae]
MLLYLHGFRSSPRSLKAQQTLAAMQARGYGEQILIPNLPASPRAAIASVEALIRPTLRETELAFIGSSLGGFYATWLAEKYGGRAVLLNPAISPWLDLQAHLGRQTIYFSDEEMTFLPQYLDELQALDTPTPTWPERYWLLACTGDEVLDWREMVAKYAEAPQTIIQGGEHALSAYPDYVGAVLDFCGYPAPYREATP